VKDLYQSLGVARDASPAEVKKAYRKLTRELHPDRNPGDAAAEERFKEVTQAYEVLGDADKRGLYDEFGDVSLTQGFDAERARAYKQAGYGPGGGGGFGRSGGFGGFSDFGNARATSFDDLLSSLFGGGNVDLGDAFGGARHAGPRRGSNIEGTIEIDGIAALQGATVPLRVNAGGETKTLDVKVPMGAHDGAKLRLRGQGGPGSPRGDILLTVRVKDNAPWLREGDHLRMHVKVPAYVAYGGGPVDVRTPWGDVTLKLKPGTQGGQTLRLRGKGVHFAGGRKPEGDLFVSLDLVMPAAGDDALLEALRRLQAPAEREESPDETADADSSVAG
jgi:curved DNA-binding protein